MSLTANQATKLGLRPGGVPLVLHTSQYDQGWMVTFTLYNGSDLYVIPEGVSGTIRCLRPDGTAYAEAVTVNCGASTVVASIGEQINIVAGRATCEIVLVDSSENRIGTANFYVEVEKAPIDDDAQITQESLAYAEQVLDELQSVAAYHVRLTQAETDIDSLESGLAAEIANRANAVSAEAAARQAADNTLQSNINSEASTRATQDASLQSQIDQLVAPSGSAPSAAEVENARIGANGITYDTLGNAIRGQVTELSSAINLLTDDGEVLKSFTWAQGSIDENTGEDNQDGVATRCRTVGFCGTDCEITVDRSVVPYGVYLYYYDANYNFVIRAGGFTTESITPLKSYPYFRIAVLNYNASGSAISAADCAARIKYKVTAPAVAQIYADMASNIKDSPVTNLFNLSDPDIITGYEIKYDNTTNANSDLSVSGYIPCEPGDTITFPVYTGHFGTGSAAKYIASYKADKTFQRSISGTLNGAILTVTIPNGYDIGWVRVNFCNHDANSTYIQTPYHAKSNFMVIKGSTMPDRYYPYPPQKFLDNVIFSEHEDITNPLYGKKVVFLGDSICEAATDSSKGYCYRIGTKNTMLWENQGIGGSTISTALASKTICTRAIKMTDPDVIILEGGTNDADRIGDATGETKPAAFGTWDADSYGTDDASTYYGFDIDTFCGAVDYMCKRFVSTYPGAKIGFIGAQKMGTVTATRKNRGYYIQTAMDICKKWGISCLDLWNGCHLNPLIPSHYTDGQTYMYVDGQHLTANGYDYISPIINAWMKTL